LRLIQGFDPCGVGARDLTECLAIQLREKDRFDPAMQALVGHLDLLAKRDFAALRKICDVEEEDILDMLNENPAARSQARTRLRRWFGRDRLPRCHSAAAADGSWQVELNTEVLPRILVNHSYVTRVGKGKARRPSGVSSRLAGNRELVDQESRTKGPYDSKGFQRNRPPAR